MANPLIEKYYELHPEVPKQGRFKHIDTNLPKLQRETIDGVRYYKVPDKDEEFLKLVSITSITSHFNKEIFVKWRKKVGDEEADRIKIARHCKNL